MSIRGSIMRALNAMEPDQRDRALRYIVGHNDGCRPKRRHPVSSTFDEERRAPDEPIAEPGRQAGEGRR